MFTPRRRRLLRAQMRDNLILLREFRLALVLFIVFFIAGTMLFWMLYEHPADRSRLTLSQALFASYSLLFFQTGNIAYPDNLLLDSLYFLIPIGGVAVIGDSVVRFAVQLFNKQVRKEEWNLSLASTYSGHVVVCGTGRVGYRLIEQLQQFGDEVVAVESNKDHPFIERVREQLNVPLIIADARRPQVLRQAGVDRAAAICPCTDNDLTNLEVALNARELNPQIRVVLRLFEPELALKVSNAFGLGSAFSTSALAAPAFAAAIHSQDIRQALYVDDELVALGEIDVKAGSLLAEMTAGQVEQRLDVNLVLHKRGRRIDHRPDHHVALQAGDHIIVFATLNGIERVKKLNETKQAG
jgi:Trk K+ transport system NAD-binding subunit